MGLPPPRKEPASPPGGPGVEEPAAELPEAPETDTLAPVSAWKPRGTDFGPPRSDPEKEDADAQHRLEVNRRRAVRRTGVSLVVLGGLAFLFGWITAYYTFWVPGVFLASQLGIPVLLATLLGGISRVLRGGIGDPTFAQATAALPRAGAWALGIFLFFFTFTTVWQLAVGLAFAILAFQLYATHDRLRRAGHDGFGPGLRLTVIPLVAYAGWHVLFEVLGSKLPLFDLFSAVAAFAFGFALLRETQVTARSVAAQHLQETGTAASAPARHGANTKQLIVGVVIGYLIFRFFIAAHIPYGPIVEWFIISLAALFFAIIAAARIGTVPTARSLPPSHVRTHQQRVWSLPDQHISEVEKHLAAYIHDNKETDWVRTHYRTLLEDSGVPAPQARQVLGGLDKRKTSEGERRTLILRLTRLMDETDSNGNGNDKDKDTDNDTDRLKTNPGLDEPARPLPDPLS